MKELRHLQLKCCCVLHETSNALSCNRKATGGHSWPVVILLSFNELIAPPLIRRGKMAQENRVPYAYNAPNAATVSAQVPENVEKSRVSTAVVHLICNQGVGGSNPSPGTITPSVEKA
jgi:hypothetical protein